MATIKDIAKMTGYSTGTVSRVLNNKADVSAKARASIEKAIKDLGFQPNANAQMLKQAISSGVYVIVRGMNNRFLVSLLENIQGRLIEHGVSTGVIFLNEVDNEIQTAKEIIRSKRPEGVVFLGGSSQSFSESFAEIGIPCVLVTASAKTLHYDNLSSISTDDYFAALFAVKKLIELQPVIQSGLVAAERMADILEMQPEETWGDIFTSIVAFELRNRESNSNIKREKSVIPYRKVPGLP